MDLSIPIKSLGVWYLWMKSAGSLIEPVALNVNKIVTLFFDFFVPERGPVDNVLEGSNSQYNPKIYSTILM